MKKTREGGTSLITLLTVLLAGFVGAAGWSAEPTPVTTVAVEAAQVFPLRSAPASVVSLNRTRLSARISARILSIPARVGDAVRRGQLLARLDCRDAELARETARARKQLAEKELQRARALKKSSSIADSRFNQAETTLIETRAALRQAALQVERCRVVAPFDGVVTARLAGVGALAVPGTPLLELLDTGDPEVSAKVDTGDLAGLRGASQVLFRTGGERFPVKLRAVLPALDPGSRRREARLTPLGAAPLPGASGRIEWRLKTPHFPARLLVERDGRLGVFIVDAGVAHFLPVSQARLGQDAPLVLPAGTRLVEQGRFTLQDGDAVEPLDDPRS